MRYTQTRKQARQRMCGCPPPIIKSLEINVKQKAYDPRSLGTLLPLVHANQRACMCECLRARHTVLPKIKATTLIQIFQMNLAEKR